MRGTIRSWVMVVLAAGLVTQPAGAQEDAGDKSDPLRPRVKMDTTRGEIVLELDAEKAPMTVLNFIDYVQDEYYDGTIFHRVIESFMIQGGGYTPEMDLKTEGLRTPVKNEWQNGLKNERGTIAMARLSRRPDSATSQFFINVVDNASLDIPRDGAGYCVFGKVVEGMDSVDKIRTVEVGAHPKGHEPTVPVEPVVIKSARVIGTFDRSGVEERMREARAEQDAEAGKKREAFTKRLEKARSEGTKTDSGLIVYDNKPGDGPTPGPTDTVEVHYTGWLTDGTKFDSSRDRNRPFTFSLTGGVIQGWLEGVATMKVGGTRTLVIPPELGYGSAGAGGVIPPNATLVFEVELLGIK